MDLHAVSKVELHRHLEGALRLQTILDLYREAGAPLPETSPEELAPRAQVLEPMGSLEEVLDVLELVQGSFTSYEAVERISYEAVEDLALDNVRLAELRFSPEFLCQKGNLDWDEAMEATARGVERGAREHDVAVGLISILSRDFGVDSHGAGLLPDLESATGLYLPGAALHESDSVGQCGLAAVRGRHDRFAIPRAQRRRLLPGDAAVLKELLCCDF